MIRIVQICHKFHCPLTLRGGGTSQAGQAIGEGLAGRRLEILQPHPRMNAAERWVRVQPGIVLDELNAQLKAHGLRFAPDISTASRATVGGMMANNSSGARSVLYGKTIDHVLEQESSLCPMARLSTFDLSPRMNSHNALHGDSLEAECYRTVRRVAQECAEKSTSDFPKFSAGSAAIILMNSPGLRSLSILSKLMWAPKAPWA